MVELSSASIAFLDMERLMKAKPIIPPPKMKEKPLQNMYSYYTCEKCGSREPGRSFLVTGKEYNYYSKLCRNCRNEDRRDFYIKNPHKVKVYQAKARCKQKGHECDIDELFLEQLIASQNNQCYYTGIEMDPAGTKSNYVASLDRIDSTKGYTKDNVVFCCDIVNTMKSNLQLDEFYSIVERIVVHKKQREASQ